MARLHALVDPLGMGVLVVLLGAILVPPFVPYGLAWEVAAWLGYGACAALLMTFRGAPIRPGAITAPRFTWHRVAGDAAVLLVTAHVAVMLVLDPFVRDYLGWLMPVHVLLGVVAGLILLLATALREPALPSRLRLLGGRRLHTWLGIVAMGFVAAHVVTSATRPIASWRLALLGAALLVVALPPVARVLGRAASPAAPGRTTMVRAALLVVVPVLGLWSFSGLRLEWLADARPLPTRFDHARHRSVNCITCHHNFRDRRLGPKGCIACHKDWGTTEARRIDTVFHAFCTDCHRRRVADGAKAGPPKSCAACHLHRR